MKYTVAVVLCMALCFEGMFCHPPSGSKSHLEMSMFDRNRDGELSGMEVYYFLINLTRTQGYTHQEARTILELVDVNGDGKLQNQEFQDCLSLLQTDTSLKTISAW